MGNCRTILEWGMNLLYPPRCPVCDLPVPLQQGLICKDCLPKLAYVKEPRCRKCGKKLYQEVGVFCEDCTKKMHYFDQGYALYEYQSVKESVYRFKYQGRAEYAKFYGKDMVRHLAKEISLMEADALIPIPIHKNRRKKRGYNQAFELAKEISKITKIPVCDGILLRTKDTIPQKELNDLQRQNNLKNAFHIPIDVVKLKRVILVDDIYTTGSTMDEAAKILKLHGVGEIYFLSLCIGEGL